MPSPKLRRSSLRRDSAELLQHAKHFQEKYILHPFWISQSMGKIENITQIPDVDIAEAGVCKYLLIEVRKICHFLPRQIITTFERKISKNYQIIIQFFKFNRVK